MKSFAVDSDEPQVTDVEVPDSQCIYLLYLLLLIGCLFGQVFILSYEKRMVHTVSY